MLQFAHPFLVAERQQILLREAADERLARLARAGTVRDTRHTSLASRVGPLVASRLGRLLPVGR